MSYPIPHWHHSRTKLNFDAMDVFAKIADIAGGALPPHTRLHAAGDDNARIHTLGDNFRIHE